MRSLSAISPNKNEKEIFDAAFRYAFYSMIKRSKPDIEFQ